MILHAGKGTCRAVPSVGRTWDGPCGHPPARCVGPEDGARRAEPRGERLGLAREHYRGERRRWRPPLIRSRQTRAPRWAAPAPRRRAQVPVWRTSSARTSAAWAAEVEPPTRAPCSACLVGPLPPTRQYCAIADNSTSLGPGNDSMPTWPKTSRFARVRRCSLGPRFVHPRDGLRPERQRGNCLRPPTRVTRLPPRA